MTDEAAVVAAVEDATAWVVAGGYAHVIVEIANEIDVPLYTHAILQPERCHELIARVQHASAGRVANRAGRLLVGTSYRGGSLPRANVTDVADVLFLHGNHVEEPDEIRAMVGKIRAAPDYRGQPIVFNEDSTSLANFDTAVARRASWGYYDQGQSNYQDGFQSPPVNWGIGSENKKQFFELVKKVTGA